MQRHDESSLWGLGGTILLKGYLQILVVPFQPRLPFPIGALPRELLEITQQVIAYILCKPQRFQGLLAESEISLFLTPLL